MRNITRFALFISMAGSAWANGYQLDIQSVRTQGTSNAGSLEAADASVSFYNPAGLTRLKGDQTSMGLIGVLPHASFDTGTAINGSGLPVAPASNGGNFAQSTVIPYGYVSHQIDDKFTVGLGIFAPYGSMLNYGEDFSGRYYGKAIRLISLTVNPSLAFKINEHHSIAVGFDAQYMSATLKKSQDIAPVAFGVCLAGGGNAIGCQPVAGAYLSQPDASVRVSGDDWGFGFNAGYIYAPDEDTRFGIAYRSSIKETLKGTARFSVPATLPGGALAPLSAGVEAALASGAGEVDITTPETVSVQLYHNLDSRWTVMADWTWTRQSRLKNIKIQMPIAAIPDRNINYLINWRDTWRVSGGIGYAVSGELTLRGGYSFDRSPVSGPAYAVTIMPDANRNTISFGGTYQFDERTSLDFAYSLMLLSKTSMNRTDTDYVPANGSPGVLTGTYHNDSHVNLLGIGFNHRF